MYNCKYNPDTTCTGTAACGSSCKQHPWHREYQQGYVRGPLGYIPNRTPVVLRAPRAIQG